MAEIESAPRRFYAHGSDGKFFEDRHFYEDSDPRLDFFGNKQKRAQWRMKRKGPSFYKFGRRVKYLGADLNDYIERCTVQTN